MPSFYRDNPFTQEYFVESDLSNYQDYRKRAFLDCAKDVVETLALTKDMTILDFGCATGGLVKALLLLGFQFIKGTDISHWAITYGKQELKLETQLEYYNKDLLYRYTDCILMLDVLEHLPNGELESVLHLTRHGLGRELLLRVPVSLKEGENYYLAVSRNDKTHLQVHCVDWWINKLKDYDLQFIKHSNTKSIYSSKGVFSAIFS